MTATSLLKVPLDITSVAHQLYMQTRTQKSIQLVTKPFKE